MRQAPLSEAQAKQWPMLEPLAGGLERPVALSKRVCVAGDRSRVNLPLPSEMVSRAHALFLCDEHGVHVRDLASLSHTFVNEQEARESDLHNGDVVKIGPYEFRISAPPSQNGDQTITHAPAAELKTPDESVHLPLTSRTVVLGKREACDVVMSGDAVTPAHAVIFELDGRRYIRDLGTHDGTYVNDQAVGQVLLNPNDVIRIGDSILKYEAAGAVAPEAAAAPALEPELPSVIKLVDEEEHAPSPAAEEQMAADVAAPSPPSPSLEPEDAEEAKIIPLLDESENAPGIPEAAVPDPGLSDSAPIPLKPDDDSDLPAPPGSQTREKDKAGGRANDPDRSRSSKARPKKPVS